jgi:hypothetical protein
MDSDVPDMAKLEPWHRSKLPVWMEGNAYLCGAEAAHQEKQGQFPKDQVYVNLVEENGHWHLVTNIYEVLSPSCRLVNTQVLGKAFEPDEAYENPDGTPITFDQDYFGAHRGIGILPGPFADAEKAQQPLF